jgi:hypothetical protein
VSPGAGHERTTAHALDCLDAAFIDRI